MKLLIDSERFVTAVRTKPPSFSHGRMVAAGTLRAKPSTGLTCVSITKSHEGIACTFAGVLSGS